MPKNLLNVVLIAALAVAVWMLQEKLSRGAVVKSVEGRVVIRQSKDERKQNAVRKMALSEGATVATGLYSRAVVVKDGNYSYTLAPETSLRIGDPAAARLGDVVASIAVGEALVKSGTRLFGRKGPLLVSTPDARIKMRRAEVFVSVYGGGGSRGGTNTEVYVLKGEIWAKFRSAEEIMLREGRTAYLPRGAAKPLITSFNPDRFSEGVFPDAKNKRELERKMCPRGMAYVPSGRLKSRGRNVFVGDFCVDKFEYPNVRGRRPKEILGADQAFDLCVQQMKRPCDNLEWERACSGPKRMRYPYGGEYREGACNVEYSDGAAGAGEFEKCRNAYGVYDMVGNLWEVTMPADGESTLPEMIRGGSWYSPASEAVCAAPERLPRNEHGIINVGFRCCRSTLPEEKSLVEEEGEE